MKRINLYFLFLLALTAGTFAQSEDEEIFLQSYTPSVLFHKGEFELKIFNNLYTQTAYFDDGSNSISTNNRSNFFTGIFSFIYGINSDLNLGLEFWLKSAKNNSVDSSPFEIFDFNNSSNSRTVVSHIGPKIKFLPFTNTFLDEVSLQSTLLFPVADNLEGSATSPFVEFDSYVWLNQFFYDKRLNDDFSLFVEFDTWFRINKEFNGSNYYDFPLKVFLSYYPSGKLTLYGMHEISTRFFGGGNAYYFHLGGGIKYQLFDFLELEALATTFYLGKNSGAGNTLNIGFRFIN